MIYLDLFWIFFRFGLISFGGVFGVLPEVQRVIVDQRHWMTAERFVQSYVVGQFVPGPNMSMCPLIGYQVAGIGGAVAAFLGIYAAPTAIVGIGYTAYRRHHELEWVRRAEIALRPLVIALIFAAGCEFFREESGKDWVGALVLGLPFMVLNRMGKIGSLTSILLTGAVWWIWRRML